MPDDYDTLTPRSAGPPSVMEMIGDAFAAESEFQTDDLVDLRPVFGRLSAKLREHDPRRHA